LSYYLHIPDMNSIPGVKQYSYLDLLVEYPDYIYVNILKNLKGVFKDFLPVPLWILFFAGLITTWRQHDGKPRMLFILSTFAPLGVIIVFYYAWPEYTQPYIPVALLLAAAGFLSFWRRLSTLWGAASSQITHKGSIALIACSLAYSAYIVLPQIPAPEPDLARRDRKDIGLLLKEKLPPGKIMTRWSHIAYYAERESVGLPNADLPTIYKSARENNVRFLVVDEWLTYHMFILPLLDPVITKALPASALYGESNEIVAPGFKPFLLYRDPEKMGVAVYSIVDQQ